MFFVVMMVVVIDMMIVVVIDDLVMVIRLFDYVRLDVVVSRWWSVVERWAERGLEAAVFGCDQQPAAAYQPNNLPTKFFIDEVT